MNNEVTLVGRVSSGMDPDHEDFCRFTVDVTRESGTIDRIPVVAPEQLIKAEYYGHTVGIRGRYRSYNQHEDGKTTLLLYVDATEINVLDSTQNVNDVFLEGFVCKKPAIRRTPSGRDITDVILSVPRENGKSDYIPCITWGAAAKFVDGLEPGSRLRVAGRLQSRDYVKNEVTRTAYELSVELVEVI